MKKKLLIFAALLAPGAAQAMDSAVPVSGRATAVLKGDENHDAHGKLKFVETGEGIRVSYRLSGLKENESYNFKLVDKKNCDEAGHLTLPKDSPTVTANEHGVAKGKFFIKDNMTLVRENSIGNKAIGLYRMNDEASEKYACGLIKPSLN